MDRQAEELSQKRSRATSEENLGPLRRLRRWMIAHHVTLMAIRDTPHSIALGTAIGIFFGFTPLFGFKTLLSIAVAWLFKSNKLAAAIAVTLHDILLPLMPAIYLWEYKFGMLALHGHMPEKMGFRHVALKEYMQWTTFLTVGLPMLIGSLFLALPCAMVVYFLLRKVIMRARASEIMP
jgi:uncharacterized protein (DUF2062 family)